MAINSPSTQFFGWKDASAGATFSVNFPKAPEMELILIGAEFYQDIEQHDRLVLHFKGKPFVKGTELKYGDPVVFKFESEKVKRNFSGTIHIVDPKNSMKANTTDVVCVGASAKLKNPDAKVYTNITADQAVTKIAKKHGMKAVTQRHPRKRKSIVQTGDVTDWQMLRRLAKQTGFALLAENTTITFMSKAKIYDSNKAKAPYFLYVDDPNGGVATKWDRNLGTITTFNAHLSDESPETGINVNRVMTGVHEKTGKVIKTKHPKEKVDLYSKGAAVPGETFIL
jgi:hypothetical protein